MFIIGLTSIRELIAESIQKLSVKYRVENLKFHELNGG